MLRISLNNQNGSVRHKSSEISDPNNSNSTNLLQFYRSRANLKRVLYFDKSIEQES